MNGPGNRGSAIGGEENRKCWRTAPEGHSSASVRPGCCDQAPRRASFTADTAGLTVPGAGSPRPGPVTPPLPLPCVRVWVHASPVIRGPFALDHGSPTVTFLTRSSAKTLFSHRVTFTGTRGCDFHILGRLSSLQNTSQLHRPSVSVSCPLSNLSPDPGTREVKRYCHLCPHRTASMDAPKSSDR